MKSKKELEETYNHALSEVKKNQLDGERAAKLINNATGMVIAEVLIDIRDILEGIRFEMQMERQKI